MEFATVTHENHAEPRFGANWNGFPQAGPINEPSLVQHTASPSSALQQQDPFRIKLNVETPSLRIRSVSDNAWSLLGIERNELMGRSVMEVVASLPQEHRSRLNAIGEEASRYLRTLPYGAVLSARITLVLPKPADPEAKNWMRMVARPMANEFGMIQQYHVEVNDVTDEWLARKVQGSIVHLDAFGDTKYHRFLQVVRISKDLNDREQAILQHMIAGKTSKEIGDFMSLSKDTVDKSRKQMLIKTGSKNSVELVSRFLNEQTLGL